MKESREIKIADRVEGMLSKDIFRNKRFEIRRDGRLIPQHRGFERHELHLYVDEGPTPTAREIADVDALVLDKESRKVKLLIEYEQDTNPKNLIGNFLAPFMADCYISNYSDDKNRYALDKETTCILLIVCLQRTRGESNREQAPIQKGEIVRKKLLGVGDKLIESSNILTGDIIIGDTLNDVEAKTRETIQSIVTNIMMDG